MIVGLLMAPSSPKSWASGKPGAVQSTNGLEGGIFCRQLARKMRIISNAKLPSMCFEPCQIADFLRIYNGHYALTISNDSMKQKFYKAFEDRFRGPQEEIARRLRAYSPFVEPIARLYPGSTVLDVGCGRGEWLEWMDVLKLEGKGLDLDEGMVSACQELDLDVYLGDGVDYLRSVDDESLAIISAIHVVEHMEFESLITFVGQALRALKPAGILIIETPNPENILVSTHSFYLDPTHSRPIPSALLAYLTEYSGFRRTKILGLQESKALLNMEMLSLLDVLGGVSPDYAVVAQKQARKSLFSVLDAAFEQDYGLGLYTLASRYDERFWETDKRSREAYLEALDAQSTSQDGRNKAEDAQARSQEAVDVAKESVLISRDAQSIAVDAINSAREAQSIAVDAINSAREAQSSAQGARVLSQQITDHLMSIYQSRSWRLTRPLRWIGRIGRKGLEQQALRGVRHLLEDPARICLRQIIELSSMHPTLEKMLKSVASQLGVNRWLKSFLLADFVTHAPPGPVMTADSMPSGSPLSSQLSPRAARIMDEFKAMGCLSEGV